MSFTNRLGREKKMTWRKGTVNMTVSGSVRSDHDECKRLKAPRNRISFM